VHGDNFWGKLVFFTISSCTTGYLVVWIGVKIAPSHKKLVAYILGIFAIAYSGMALYGNLILGEYWSIWQMFVIIVTVGYVLYSIGTDEDDITRD
jgi:hypothetical protein